MPKRTKKPRSWTAAEVRELKTIARGNAPAKIAKTLRTKTGRHVIPSPAKSATSVSGWSQAFHDK
jgi:hypothetical protein